MLHGFRSITHDFGGAAGPRNRRFRTTARRRPRKNDPEIVELLVRRGRCLSCPKGRRAAGLLVLRVAAQKPVPELIPERALALGCAAGIALFIAGNFVAAHLSVR